MDDTIAYRKKRSDIVRNLLEPLILQALKNKSIYGYDIILKIEKIFGVLLGPSTIYPKLQSLENDGFVKSVWNIGFDRPKRMYTLTEEGIKLLVFYEKTMNMFSQNVIGNEI